MEPGILIYKCRRCGQEVKNIHAPDILTTVISAMMGTKTPWGGIPVDKTDIHACSDGGVGVTDLIGAERDK